MSVVFNLTKCDVTGRQRPMRALVSFTLQRNLRTNMGRTRLLAYFRTRLVQVDRLVSYPIVFLHRRFKCVDIQVNIYNKYQMNCHLVQVSQPEFWYVVEFYNSQTYQNCLMWCWHGHEASAKIGGFHFFSSSPKDRLRINWPKIDGIQYLVPTKNLTENILTEIIMA